VVAAAEVTGMRAAATDDEASQQRRAATAGRRPRASVWSLSQTVARQSDLNARSEDFP
jgi:hypothetical protein